MALHRMDHIPAEELTMEQVGYVEQIRERFKALDGLIEQACPNNRARSLAQTNLDQARMWAIQAITHGEATNLQQGR